MTKTRELEREILPPQNLNHYDNLITKICFRSNDDKIDDADTILIFGATSNLKGIKDQVLYILNRAKIKYIIICGGITDKTSPLSEAEIIADYIKDIIPQEIHILKENKSSNLKENVLFALNEFPHLTKCKICFITKYFAAGRTYLTLRQNLPHTLLMQRAYEANGCKYDAWAEDIQSSALVWAEIVRIYKYGKRGDLLFDLVKNDFDYLIKSNLLSQS